MSEENKNGDIFSLELASKFADQINNSIIPVMFNGHKEGYCLKANMLEDGTGYSCTIKMDSDKFNELMDMDMVRIEPNGMVGSIDYSPDGETKLIKDFELISFSLVQNNPYQKDQDSLDKEKQDE